MPPTGLYDSLQLRDSKAVRPKNPGLDWTYFQLGERLPACDVGLTRGQQRLSGVIEAGDVGSADQRRELDLVIFHLSVLGTREHACGLGGVSLYALLALAAVAPAENTGEVSTKRPMLKEGTRKRLAKCSVGTQPMVMTKACSQFEEMLIMGREVLNRRIAEDLTVGNSDQRHCDLGYHSALSNWGTYRESLGKTGAQQG